MSEADPRVRTRPKTHPLLTLLVAILSALMLALGLPKSSSGVNAYFCNAGYLYSPGAYCSDNNFNNHNFMQFYNQQSNTYAEYVGVFGVQSGGSWCCAANAYGNVANSFPATYIKVYCWNRSDYVHNIIIAGWCQRST
jgi:hypothetical protein